MSESKLISAVLADKQIHHLLQNNVDVLLVTHKDIWEFIKQYYTDNNTVPPLTLIIDKFPDFVPEKGVGATKYHLDELRAEYLDRELRQIIRSAAEEVSDGKQTSAMSTLSNGIRNLNQEVNVVKDVDAADTDSAVDYMKRLADGSAHTGIKTDLLGLDMCFPSGIRGGQFGIVLAYPAVGKPTTLDTPVATPNGWVKKGDLVPGDYVIARDGCPTKVLATIDQGMLDGYRVSFRDGTSVIVGPDHDWDVYSRDTYYGSRKTFVKTTTELLESGLFYEGLGDETRMPLPKWCIPNVAPVDYDKKRLPIDPYTLGVLLGDGYIKKQPIFITDDEDVATKIQENNPEYVVSKHKKFRGAGQKYLIKGLMPAIRGLGINSGSHDKRVPTEYLFASIEQRLELLRGLMDSDGSCPLRVRAMFHSCNNGLAQDVAELVRSLGGTARIDTYVRSDKKPTEYSVKMRLPFNPFSLKRKADNYIVKDWPRWIESIEYVGKRQMRCITVESQDHLYAVNDYILTHNSYFTLYLLAKAWLQGFTPMIVSLEMTETEVRNRLYTILGNGRWSLRKLSRGGIDIEEFERWHHKTFDGKQPFHIISTDSVGGEVTPEVLRSKINQYRPDVVGADYMQLMMPSTGSDSEVVKMKNLSRELKLLAMSEKVPIIAISSATPTDSQDMSEPPTLGQTAWSRQIAYDSDWVLSLGRDLSSDIMQVVGRKNREGMLPDFLLEVDMDMGIFNFKNFTEFEE